MGTETRINAQHSDPDLPTASARQFATTRWSAVLAAAKGGSTGSVEALDQLCRTYWYPLYAWVRREGHAAHDAEDLIQGFFARLIQKEDLAAVDPARGRFRSFLLAALKHYLANERDRSRAWKRGGRHVIVPLQTDMAESRYGAEPVDTLSADQIYDRRWALTVLDRVMFQLRIEFRRRGKEWMFDQLKNCLTPERAALSYAELARQVGLSESALKVSIHRLRQRYRELIQDEIAQTVGDPGLVREEMRELMNVLLQPPN
jgi:RNA polymerase sigma factor (sigma-70 family)